MRHTLFYILILVLLTGCSREPTNADGSSGGGHNPSANQTPVTHLFLNPDSTGLDTSASVLEVHWWGNDPDGWITGYYLRWDFFGAGSVLQDSIWLSTESAIFYLPLDSAYDEFTLSVRAADNTAAWNYPAMIKACTALGAPGVVTANMQDYIEYEAFLDVGSQPGMLDSGDSLIWAGNMTGVQAQYGLELEELPSPHLMPPTGTTGALDPAGASLLFPVRNTAPLVEWRLQSNPDLLPGQTVLTFPTRSFFWEVSDLDGNQTIDSCFWALDPLPGDTLWNGLTGAQSSVTLTNLPAGQHRMFVKIQDIAGAQSATIRFPDDDDRFWEVQAPVGDLLIVDDYALNSSNTVLNFYKSIFDTLTGVLGQYSVWEVGEELPYSGGDVLATLNYFDRALWFSFYGISHYTEAMGPIGGYLAGGGGLLITALQVDTTSGIIPVSQYGSGLLRVSPPNGFTPQVEGWPDLALSTSFSNEVFGFAASDQGQILYNVGSGATWTGLPGMCVRRTDDWKLVFFGVPLHLLNGSGTLPEFLDKVLNEEFGP
jgi:hypothetical protein